MSRSAGTARAQTGLALAAALTVWVTTLSWIGFTEAWAAFVVPLLGLAVLVAVTGALLRRTGTAWPLVLLGQVVVSGAACSLVLTGYPVPLGPGAERLATVLGDAVETSTAFAAPVPAAAPGIHPVLLLAGLGTLLVVDAVACTWRRVPLAGLPLLAVYSVPVSVLGAGAGWWVFVLGAAGFLLVLHLDALGSVDRWGRALGGSVGGDPRREGLDVRTGTARAMAGTVGAVTVAASVALPLVLPTLDLQVFDVGPGSGDGRIEVTNPMVDLRRDLRQGPDVPLVRVVTDDPAPSYLRISVLTNYTDDEWTAGDRDVPLDQVPDGTVPGVEGLSPTVRRVSYDYEANATDDFVSRWLPTQAPVSRVVAEGDWRFDTETMDFIAADDELTTAGARWSMTAVQPRLDADDLATARPVGLDDVDPGFLALPDGVPDLAGDLAAQVTEGAETDFARAVALQRWFREDGGFTYSLERAPSGNGADELSAFLSTTPGGRVGYCEQFAAAMAVMSRELGIPARVAVGFLQPRRLADEVWEYSARDLHAWPELYFPGAGWVRFEPTPAGRAATVPSYTRTSGLDVAPEPAPSAAPPSRAPSVVPRDEPRPLPQEQAPVETAPSGEQQSPWLGRVAVAAALLLLVALLGLPALLRRRQRERRLAGDAEDCWAELGATALDLALPWAEGDSPRQTQQALRLHLAPSVLSSGPEAREAMQRLTTQVERGRYAREGAATGGVTTGEDTRVVLAALESAAGPGPARRARWAPRSLLRSLLRGPRRRSGSGSGSGPQGPVDDTPTAPRGGVGVLEKLR